MGSGEEIMREGFIAAIPVKVDQPFADHPPIMIFVEPGCDPGLAHSFDPARVSDPPSPPQFCARGQGSALAHLPCPLHVHSSPRRKFRKGFGNHLAAGFLLVAIFQHHPLDFRSAGNRRTERGRFGVVESYFVFSDIPPGVGRFWG